MNLFVSMTRRRVARACCVVALATGTTLPAQSAPLSTDTITTASGLRYLFTQRGSGAVPRRGDVLVLHGIGRLTDGTEFWNSRTDEEPFAYRMGYDPVIRGFGEGMTRLRQGDRVIMIMPPEIAYGARGTQGVPPNATLVFDYEILSVHEHSVHGALQDGMDNIDSTLAALRAAPNLSSYHAYDYHLLADAKRAAERDSTNEEKILTFGLTVLPTAYRLPLALARLEERRGRVAEAIAHYDAAQKLNPRRSADHRADYANAELALTALRQKRFEPCGAAGSPACVANVLPYPPDPFPTTRRSTPVKITVSTIVAAPRADVWRAYTTPEDIMAWNAASSDWHTTAASVDLRPGGKFSSRMEAKDGSFGFDFAGEYTTIIDQERIEYTFGDREAVVTFTESPGGVTVTVTFDGEETHTEEQQRAGWQAILDNFARHVLAARG